MEENKIETIKQMVEYMGIEVPTVAVYDGENIIIIKYPKGIVNPKHFEAHAKSEIMDCLLNKKISKKIIL